MNLERALVVATWNHVALTKRFLRSFTENSFEAWHLIVVDNGSTDETPALLQNYKAVSPHQFTFLRNDHNEGCARAWNRGLRAASAAGAQLCGVLNNDLVLAPDWDRGLVDFWRREAKHHPVFSPFVMHSRDLARFAAQAVHFMRRNARRRRWRMRSEALFLDRSVLERVGYFDEDFFVSFEDFDYFLRLQRAGIRPLTLGSSVVWHELQASRRDLSPQHVLQGQKIFVTKWGSAALQNPAFEIPAWRRRWWRLREFFGRL